MKNCRTLTSLLKSIENGEDCCLKYTNISPTENGYIIYQQNGTNLIISDRTYHIIKDYLKQV